MLQIKDSEKLISKNNKTQAVSLRTSSKPSLEPLEGQEVLAILIPLPTNPQMFQL